jgi:hypothetical protein
LALGGAYRFLKKATRFLCISFSFLRKAFAEMPPFPPLKKGGGEGISEGHFKKLNSYKFRISLKYPVASSIFVH